MNNRSDERFLSNGKSTFFHFVKHKIISLFSRKNNEKHQIIPEVDNGKLSVDNSNMLQNLAKFGGCVIRDIMIPRTEIYSVNINSSKEDLISKIVEGQHTRVPVYKNNLDNIVGFVHIKDILSNFNEDFDLKSIIYKVIFIPPSMKAINLFIKMQSSHTHVAVVLDEYGGTEGLVTMADIIEEIVGSIDDEHDEPPIPDFVRISKNKVETMARVLVKSLEEFLSVELRDHEEEEDYVTIGGLILAMIGRVPSVGEILTHKTGIKFIINEANERCIYKLTVDLADYNKNVEQNKA